MPFDETMSPRQGRSSNEGFPDYPRLPQPVDPMMSVFEVARPLGISASTVRRLIKAGKLKAHRVGGQLRIAEEDLRVFLDSACL
jgi:excisionase family DNA binding protein